MSDLPDAVARFRSEYRAAEIAPRYRGGAHFAFTTVFSLGGIALCALQLERPTPLEWLAVPLTFLYANLAEYWGHRVPMHRPLPGLKLVYRRHAGQHHRFFTDQAMPLDEWRDLRAVLFPPILASFFLLAFGVPAGLLVAWLSTPNVGWLFGATALGYFYNYEVLHLAYHVPEAHWLARVPGIRRLRWLHRTHHDPALMTRHNFNITYPIGDLLFGTLARRS